MKTITKNLLAGAGTLVAVALVFSAGVASVPTPEPQTVEVPGPVQTKVVYKVPDSCLHALDAGEQGFGIVAQILQNNGEAWQAIARDDYSALQGKTTVLLALNDQLGQVSDPWNNFKADCRAGQ